jgi:hypothetical protein
VTDASDLIAGEPEQLQVAFPATPTFTRIGRVAVVGLALRLGHDVATVEKLRSAVDEAVSALQGAGRIEVRASWTATELTVILANPDAAIVDQDELTDRLTELVKKVSTDSTTVQLILDTPET